MDWVEPFYSKTAQWWGRAEAPITDTDRLRADLVSEAAPRGCSVLELGCGYGSSALACAQAGFSVTGIDLSDRIDHFDQIGLYTIDPPVELHLVKADFLSHDFGRRFHAVTYWDGFGVGTDADQLELLNRIGDEWLIIDGIALLEVFDSRGWSNDHGMSETLTADPDRGYEHTLHHRREFDRTTRRALDIWTEHGTHEEWTQSLRCYSPDEFSELAARSNLELVNILSERRTDWSYLVHLTRLE